VSPFRHIRPSYTFPKICFFKGPAFPFLSCSPHTGRALVLFHLGVLTGVSHNTPPQDTSVLRGAFFRVVAVGGEHADYISSSSCWGRAFFFGSALSLNLSPTLFYGGTYNSLTFLGLFYPFF